MIEPGLADSAVDDIKGMPHTHYSRLPGAGNCRGGWVLDLAEGGPWFVGCGRVQGDGDSPVATVSEIRPDWKQSARSQGLRFKHNRHISLNYKSNKRYLACPIPKGVSVFLWQEIIWWPLLIGDCCLILKPNHNIVEKYLCPGNVCVFWSLFGSLASVIDPSMFQSALLRHLAIHNLPF